MWTLNYYSDGTSKMTLNYYYSLTQSDMTLNYYFCSISEASLRKTNINTSMRTCAVNLHHYKFFSSWSYLPLCSVFLFAKTVAYKHYSFHGARQVRDHNHSYSAPSYLFCGLLSPTYLISKHPDFASSALWCLATPHRTMLVDDTSIKLLPLLIFYLLPPTKALSAKTENNTQLSTSHST